MLIAVGAAAGLVGLAWSTSERTSGRRIEYVKCQPTGKPRAVGAASAQLPDNTPVIGVTVGGRFRAYALRAFAEIEAHVVNDLLGGIPVTVAHCPVTGCTRVYTAPDLSRPLDVAVGGWSNPSGAEVPGADSVMVLRVGADHFLQDTGTATDGTRQFPYREVEFAQTTWGEWKLAHPETDIVDRPNASQ